jgi:hypothetical protein
VRTAILKVRTVVLKVGTAVISCNNATHERTWCGHFSKLVTENNFKPERLPIKMLQE